MTPDPTIEALDQSLTSLLADVRDTAYRMKAQCERDLPRASVAPQCALIDAYVSVACSEIELMSHVLPELASARRKRMVEA